MPFSKEQIDQLEMVCNSARTKLAGGEYEIWQDTLVDVENSLREDVRKQKIPADLREYGRILTTPTDKGLVAKINRLVSFFESIRTSIVDEIKNGVTSKDMRLKISDMRQSALKDAEDVEKIITDYLDWLRDR